MENSVDLTLRSIHRIAWRTDEAALSGVKAYVSFSGSVPNMKVSSSAMCHSSGSLAIESNAPELVGAEGTEKRQFLNIDFADPFQEKKLNKKLSPISSSSSETSGSSHRPHLQFPLRGGNVNTTSDAQTKAEDILKFHIVFRSLDDGLIAEGEVNLKLPEINFENLPLALDLPITKGKIAKIPRGEATKYIYFDESAYIRVQLDDSRKHQYNPPARNDIVFCEEKVHEDEDMQKPAKSKTAERPRVWAIGCTGVPDLKQSIKSFFEGVRGMQKKCQDPEELQLFTSSTMTSTILTRESLEI